MANPDPLPLLTRPQVALLLSSRPAVISLWETEGLPVAERGKPGISSRYDPAAVVSWYVQHELGRVTGKAGILNPSAEKARKDRASAELDELKLAERRGEVLPRSIYEQELTPPLLAFRTKTLAAPRAWAPMLTRAAAEGVAAVERELTARIRELLTTLAGLGPSGSKRRSA